MRNAILAAVGVVVIIVAVAWVTGAIGRGPTPSPSPSSIAALPSASASASSSSTLRPSPTLSPSPSPSPTAIPSAPPSAVLSPSVAASSPPAPTPSATVAAAATPTLFTSVDGYSMSVPGGWTTTAVGPSDTNVLLALLSASNPDLANLVSNILNLTHAQPSMIGADLRQGGSVPPNVTVLIQPSGGVPLDFVGSVVQALVPQIPGATGPATRQKVSLPSGDAIRLDYQVKTSTGAVIGLRTFVIVQGDRAFLVTFTAAADQFGAKEPSFEQMIQSLHFGT